MIEIVEIYLANGKIVIDREREIFQGCIFDDVEFFITGNAGLPLFIGCSFRGGNVLTLDKTLFSDCYFENPDKP